MNLQDFGQRLRVARARLPGVRSTRPCGDQPASAILGVTEGPAWVEDPNAVDEAHRATASGEQDAKIARALVKAWDKGVGVTATPAKAAATAAGKKGASRSSDRAKR